MEESHLSVFANSALLGGGARVRVWIWIREQRKIKRRLKALPKSLMANLDITHKNASKTEGLGMRLGLIVTPLVILVGRLQMIIAVM